MIFFLTFHGPVSMIEFILWAPKNFARSYFPARFFCFFAFRSKIRLIIIVAIITV